MNKGDWIIGINDTITSDYFIAGNISEDSNHPVQITDYNDKVTYFKGGFIYTEELENFIVI